MARVKGTAIAGRLTFARRKGGEEAVAQLLAAVSDPAEAEQLRLTGALKASWYQFRTFIDSEIKKWAMVIKQAGVPVTK